MKNFEIPWLNNLIVSKKRSFWSFWRREFSNLAVIKQNLLTIEIAFHGSLFKIRFYTSTQFWGYAGNWQVVCTTYELFQSMDVLQLKSSMYFQIWIWQTVWYIQLPINLCEINIIENKCALLKYKDILNEQCNGNRTTNGFGIPSMIISKMDFETVYTIIFINSDIIEQQYGSFDACLDIFNEYKPNLDGYNYLNLIVSDICTYINYKFGICLVSCNCCC